jgi:uncharacterized DUF497 family protein
MDVVHRLNDITFVWDDRKASSNLQKHGVALETACEVFFDPFVLLHHAEVIGGEDRETAIGLTGGWRVLVVVYTLRDDSIRIISARPATSHERSHYENGQAP